MRAKRQKGWGPKAKFIPLPTTPEMKIRKSRCNVAIALTLFVNLVVLLVLRGSGGPAGLYPFFPFLFGAANSNSGLGGGYVFEEWVDRLVKRAIKEAGDQAGRLLRYKVYGLTPEEAQDRDLVPLPPFLVEGAEVPYVAPYDARLTMAMLLRMLTGEAATAEGTLQARSDQDTPATPESGTARSDQATSKSGPALRLPSFHWADWTDLSFVEREMMALKKPACADVFRTKPKNRRIDPFVQLPFCVSHPESTTPKPATPPDMPATYAAAWDRLWSRSLHPGYYVYNDPKFTTVRERIAAARLYLYHFMPAPYLLQMLVPAPDGPVLVGIDVPTENTPGARDRILFRPEAQAVAKQASQLLLQQEIARMQNMVSGLAPPTLAQNLPLSQNDFEDTLKDILDSYKGKPLGDMPPAEAAYVQTLQASLASTDPPKYFYEATLARSESLYAHGAHHDWRFFRGIAAREEVFLAQMHGLIRAWLKFAWASGTPTWIAHGTLLSWYWNGLAFPWDPDVDVQMPVLALHTMARRYNQLLIVDIGQGPEPRLGRYFLDCGTWISHREDGNGKNNIDARFIDVDTGIYVDITALAVTLVPTPPRYTGEPDSNRGQTDKNHANKPAGIVAAKLGEDDLARLAKARQELQGKRDKLSAAELLDELLQAWRHVNRKLQLYNCRNRHFSLLPELGPLRLSVFEGVPAYVPSNITSLLWEEYGYLGIHLPSYQTMSFIPRLRLWAHTQFVNKYVKNRAVQAKSVKLGRHAAVAASIRHAKDVHELYDNDLLAFLWLQPNLLMEYAVTHHLTEAHQQRLEALLTGSPDHTVPAKELPEFRPAAQNFLALKLGQSLLGLYQMYQLRYNLFKEGKTLTDDALGKLFKDVIAQGVSASKGQKAQR